MRSPDCKVCLDLLMILYCIFEYGELFVYISSHFNAFEYCGEDCDIYEFVFLFLQTE